MLQHKISAVNAAYVNPEPRVKSAGCNIDNNGNTNTTNTYKHAMMSARLKYLNIKLEATAKYEEDKHQLLETLAYALEKTIDNYIKATAKQYNMRVIECDECEPTENNYLTTSNAKWFVRGYCAGIINNKHIQIDYVVGYNGRKVQASLYASNLVNEEHDKGDA